MLLISHVRNVTLHLAEPSVDGMSNCLSCEFFNCRTKPPRPPSKFKSEFVVTISDMLSLVFDCLSKTYLHGGRSKLNFWWVKYQWRMISSEVNRVIPRTADNIKFKTFTSAENINLIITSCTINLNRLNINKIHDLPCPSNKVFSDNKSIGNGSTYNNQGINSWPPVDKGWPLIKVIVSIGSRTSKSIS